MIFTIENLLLLVVLIIAMMTDIRNHRIPNWLTLPAIITGIGVNLISAGTGGFLFGMEGLLLGSGLFMVIYIMGGMGAGDVKLMGAVGSMLGPQMVLLAALYTALSGGVYALAVITFHPRARTIRVTLMERMKLFIFYDSVKYERPQTIEKPPKLCYGVAIAIGTIATVILQDVIKMG
jgi:prepilin peptidase CpaA